MILKDFKGELVRKELFHVGGIREKGRGIGKSVWMKILRIEGRRVGKRSVTVGIRKREGGRVLGGVRWNN